MFHPKACQHLVKDNTNKESVAATHPSPPPLQIPDRWDANPLLIHIPSNQEIKLHEDCDPYMIRFFKHPVLHSQISSNPHDYLVVDNSGESRPFTWFLDKLGYYSGDFSLQYNGVTSHLDPLDNVGCYSDASKKNLFFVHTNFGMIESQIKSLLGPRTEEGVLGYNPYRESNPYIKELSKLVYVQHEYKETSFQDTLWDTCSKVNKIHLSHFPNDAKDRVKTPPTNLHEQQDYFHYYNLVESIHAMRLLQHAGAPFIKSFPTSGFHPKWSDRIIRFNRLSLARCSYQTIPFEKVDGNITTMYLGLYWFHESPELRKSIPHGSYIFKEMYPSTPEILDGEQVSTASTTSSNETSHSNNNEDCESMPQLVEQLMSDTSPASKSGSLGSGASRYSSSCSSLSGNESDVSDDVCSLSPPVSTSAVTNRSNKFKVASERASTHQVKVAHVCQFKDKVAKFQTFKELNKNDKIGYITNDKPYHVDSQLNLSYSAAFLSNGFPSADLQLKTEEYTFPNEKTCAEVEELTGEAVVDYSRAIQQMSRRISKLYNTYTDRYVYREHNPEWIEKNISYIYAHVLYSKPECGPSPSSDTVKRLEDAWKDNRKDGLDLYSVDIQREVLKATKLDYIAFRTQTYTELLDNALPTMTESPTGKFCIAVAKEARDRAQFLEYLSAGGICDVENCMNTQHMGKYLSNIKFHCPCHFKFHSMMKSSMDDTSFLKYNINTGMNDGEEKKYVTSIHMCDFTFSTLAELEAHLEQCWDTDACHRLIPAFVNRTLTGTELKETTTAVKKIPKKRKVVRKKTKVVPKKTKVDPKKRNENSNLKGRSQKKRSPSQKETWVVNTVERGNMHYTSTNLFSTATKSRLFYKKLNGDSYLDALTDIMKGGTEMTTPTRSVPMYCYGSTMFGGPTPKFVDQNTREKHMLPRPYGTYRPGELGDQLLQKEWMKDLISFLMDQLWMHIHNLREEDEPEARRLAGIVRDSCDLIHPSLRIGDSCFTQFHAVGDRDAKGAHVNLHKDAKDLITIIVTLSLVYKGGATVYYTGDSVTKNIGRLSKEVPFVHGRVQIGSYDTVIHGVKPFNGTRVTLNFNLKSNTLTHFQENGDKFYLQYYNSGLPKEMFIADYLSY